MAAQIHKKSLMAKARGITSSIDKMTDTERQANPSGEYGDDYNKLRGLVLQQYPHLKELIPPPVELLAAANGLYRFTRQRYAEINSFCEQLFQLLSEEE